MLMNDCSGNGFWHGVQYSAIRINLSHCLMTQKWTQTRLVSAARYKNKGKIKFLIKIHISPEILINVDEGLFREWQGCSYVHKREIWLAKSWGYFGTLGIVREFMGIVGEYMNMAIFMLLSSHELQSH